MRRRNPAQKELLPTARVEAELAREVPVRVSMEMSPEQFARYEALWEKLHKLGGVSAGTGRAEVMLEALAGRVVELESGTLNGTTASEQIDSEISAPRGAGRAGQPRFQINVHKCPDCERATIQTGAGEKRIRTAEMERIECDATIVQRGGRARSAIPPKTRREVLNRDRNRCQGPGCTHTRFLEIHHQRPVARGGGNESENLVTLCGACHRLLHERTQVQADRWPT